MEKQKSAKKLALRFLGYCLIRILAGSHILLNFQRNSPGLETLKLLYHGIFHPFISYGIQVWGLTYKSCLDPFFVLQKNYYLSDITSPSTPIFCELNLLTLYDIHNLPVAFFVSECVNGLSPSYFHEYFKLTSSKHIIRTCQFTIGNLFLERRNTDQYGIWSIQCYGVILWNSIPPEIRNFDIYCMCSVQIENTLYFSVYCVR